MRLSSWECKGKSYCIGFDLFKIEARKASKRIKIIWDGKIKILFVEKNAWSSMYDKRKVCIIFQMIYWIGWTMGDGIDFIDYACMQIFDEIDLKFERKMFRFGWICWKEIFSFLTYFCNTVWIWKFLEDQGYVT